MRAIRKVTYGELLAKPTMRKKKYSRTYIGFDTFRYLLITVEALSSQPVLRLGKQAVSLGVRSGL
jgi:hypothetical protein